MRIFKITQFVLCAAIIFSCSGRQEYTDEIILKEGEHLWDTPSGKFLAPFKYLESDQRNVLYKIDDGLAQHAELKAEYFLEDRSLVREWKYLYNSESFHLRQYFYDGPPNREIEIVFAPMEKTFSSLIGVELANQLPEGRKYKSAFTITSPTDEARLFLMGFGKYCDGILLRQGFKLRPNKGL